MLYYTVLDVAGTHEEVCQRMAGVEESEEESVDAPIPEVVRASEPEAIVKSVGSKSHVPVLPFGAWVETLVVSAIFKFLPDVSTNPPSSLNCAPKMSAEK